jgi:hypothetical protein
MKKILYVVSSLKVTGLTTVLVNTALNLDRSKFEPVVVTLGAKADRGYEDELEAADISVINLAGGRFGIFFSPKTFIEIIDSQKPDIVHAHCLRSFVFSSLYLGKHKRFMTLHSLVKYNFKYEFGDFKGGILDKIVDWTIGKHDVAIGVSRAVQEHYREEKNIDVEAVVNGVELKNFEFSEVKRKIIRKEIGLSDSEFVCIFTGSLSDRKQIVPLLQTFEKSEQKVMVLGGGPLLQELRNKYQEHASILILGPQSNVVDYLSAADIYLSFSKSEGMPNAVIEALNTGLNALLSDIPPHKELKSEFVDQVRITSLNEVLKHVQAVRESGLSLSDRKIASQRNSLIVESNFSNHKMAEGYSELYLKYLTEESVK